MKRTRRTLTPDERAKAAAFHESVYGERCAVCGGMAQEAHHVVEAAELRRRHLPPYDVRNCLPVCRVDHELHTNAARRIPFRHLRAANIDYAYEVLGPFAADYLRKKYPMTGKS